MLLNLSNDTRILYSVESLRSKICIKIVHESEVSRIFDANL